MAEDKWPETPADALAFVWDAYRHVSDSKSGAGWQGGHALRMLACAFVRIEEAIASLDDKQATYTLEQIRKAPKLAHEFTGVRAHYLLNTDRHIIEWTEHLANWLTNRGHQGLLALIREFIENKG